MSRKGATESTWTADADAGRPTETEQHALRWVFPLPPPPPSWLSATRTTIGRSAECTLRLEGGHVSRHHATITRSGPLWIVSDADSKNGIRVNGRPVREQVIAPGDVLRVGDFVAVVVSAPPTADLSCGDLAPGIYGGFRLRALIGRMREVAEKNLTVVLEGETGTGKETLARALHQASRRPGPFRAVNCAVYSKNMAAAELFGYRKGAFTGADAASVGHIRAAQDGTLLLDELTELAPDVQAMLLRVLENREVLPLGESRPQPIDVRFLAATQIPLAAAVKAGNFRSDLRARLEGVVIALPPLRESRETVVETFLWFVEKHAAGRPALNAGAAERLAIHPWTLNVRELDTVARRIANKSTAGQPLDAEALEAALGTSVESEVTPAPQMSSPSRRDKMPVYRPEEIAALEAALSAANGNLSRAASALGLTRAKAYRMLAALRSHGKQ
jgi:transcriptional regulator of acetoin/glycerol metabolism